MKLADAVFQEIAEKYNKTVQGNRAVTLEHKREQFMSCVGMICYFSKVVASGSCFQACQPGVKSAISAGLLKAGSKTVRALLQDVAELATVRHRYASSRERLPRT